MDAPRRIGFRLQYDGTQFHGWQAQVGLRTVQGALQDLLRAQFDPEATVDGASRTDAGVHARDQVAATTLRHRIAPGGLVRALNARLGSEVALQVAWEAAPDFQPRFAAAGKTYAYRLYQSQTPWPLVDRYAWRIGWTLDVDAMRAAAAPLLGEHDFTSFAAGDAGQATMLRTLHAIEVEPGTDAPLVVTVRGQAFLKQMVRNIVGTLVEVGRGHRQAASVAGVLAGRDRRLAGPTAPARGLTLERVWYEPPVAPSPGRGDVPDLAPLASESRS